MIIRTRRQRRKRKTCKGICLEEIMNHIKQKADDAYCQYIDQMRKPEALGHVAKMAVGKFGEVELAAHTNGSRLYGQHQAFAEVAPEFAALWAENDRLKADASWAATHRSELDSLRKAFAEAEATNKEWLKQNGRGGWIDNLRVACDEMETALRIARFDVEYKRDHSQTAFSRRNAARTIEKIDAALVRVGELTKA